MPIREEIVEQINKAADIFEMIGIEFLGEKVLKEYADKLRISAAQVSAMRCETCKKDVVYTGIDEWVACPWNGSGGCFSHKPKEKE